MSHAFHYGTDRQIDLTPRPGAHFAHVRPQAAALEFETALIEALDHPLGLPPLSLALAPGDQVAVALDENLPQAATAVRTVVEYLARGGIPPTDVTVVRTAPSVVAADRSQGASNGAEAPATNSAPPASGDPLLIAELPDPLGEVIAGLGARQVFHNARERAELAFVNVDEEGHEVLLNRALVDADVMISLGCLHVDNARGYHGPHSAWYPRFADEAAQQRFRLWQASSGQEKKEAARQAAEQAGWLLGALYTVQVVPGDQDAVDAVLSGSYDEVGRQGQRRCSEVWQATVARRARLAVVSIGGDAAQQTWDNFGRALETALQVCEEGGVVAMCSQLAQRPGPGVSMIAQAPSPAEAVRILKKTKPVDLLPALALVTAAERNTSVYLLSQLAAGVVEDIGLAPVADSAELGRLCGQFESCIAIESGQHADVEFKPE